MIAYTCGRFWRHYVVPALPATIARAQKRTNKPRMFMKTNSRYRMHRAVVALTFRSARRQSKNADLKVGATNCREQSENVYENKGRGQTVTGWRRPRLVGLCDAPEAQACQVVPSVLTCPFGISQTPNARGLRHPLIWKLSEQSENVYENKGRGQTVTGWRRPRLVGLCDAPEAQACQVVPSVLTCPFRTSQTPDIRGLRHPSTRKLWEQSENVYENKQSRS